MSNGQDNQSVREFCERFCTVRQQHVDNDFLSSEELRKVRQRRPTIQTLYRIEPSKSHSFRNALRDLNCINRLIDLL